jgi:hypothetical protein
MRRSTTISSFKTGLQQNPWVKTVGCLVRGVIVHHEVNLLPGPLFERPVEMPHEGEKLLALPGTPWVGGVARANRAA